MADLKPHQQRVVQEKAELDIKIEKLTAFGKSDTYTREVSREESVRLARQLKAMHDYSGILGERIANFPK